MVAASRRAIQSAMGRRRQDRLHARLELAVVGQPRIVGGEARVHLHRRIAEGRVCTLGRPGATHAGQRDGRGRARADAPGRAPMTLELKDRVVVALLLAFSAFNGLLAWLVTHAALYLVAFR